jgi:uncharacterized membrane protein
MKKFSILSAWILLYLAAVLFVIASSRYFVPDMPDAFQPEVYSHYALILRLHIAAGIAAMLIGPVQFNARFRNSYPKWHGRLGKTYVVAVFLSAPTGLILASVSFGGMVTHVGFALLSVCWGLSTFIGFKCALSKQWSAHLDWMTRSLALTVAFVMLRAWQTVFGLCGVPEVEAYQTVSWLCWVPNLIFAEIMIGMRKRSGTKTEVRNDTD